VRDLINKIPVNQLGIVTDFLKNVPPEKAEETARQLFEKIQGLTNGILRSPDPKAELERCIQEVQKRQSN